MFTTKTKIDVEVQKELSKKIYKNSLIALIVGAVGLAVYIVLGTIFENYWLDLLLVFAIPFGFGLVFIITIKKLMKKVEDINQINEYVFEEVFVNVSTIRNGESVGTAKIYYKDLVKSKETQNYIYMYINKSAALPVKKENLTQDELIVLRSLLKLELLPEKFKGN
jgi:hypothetical protein